MLSVKIFFHIRLNYGSSLKSRKNKKPKQLNKNKAKSTIEVIEIFILIELWVENHSIKQICESTYLSFRWQNKCNWQ